MNILYANVTKQEEQALQDGFYQKLIDYLATYTPPTLRQLKQEFPTIKVERKLEKLINLGWICRHERRYFSTRFLYDATRDQAIVQEMCTRLLSYLQSYEAKRLLYYCTQEFEQQKVMEIVPSEFIYCYPATINSTQLSLSAYAATAWPMTLPHYFLAMRQQLQLQQYESLEQLIGDVDPEYFLDQIQVMLEKKARQRILRPSIFLTAAKQTSLFSEHAIYQVDQDPLSDGAQRFYKAFQQLSPIIQGQVLGSALKQSTLEPFIVLKSQETVENH